MDHNLMAVQYMLADGKTVRLEVPACVKEALDHSDRQERTRKRKDRRYGLLIVPNDELDTRLVAQQPGGLELLVRAEERARLIAALDSLTEKQCRRLLLRVVHGWTYSKIAQHEKVSAGSIRKGVERALLLLRESLVD